MPKFSIVVPIYNMEDYLERCIRSILNQTFQDFELILVDDGSSDCCPEICKRFERMDSRITVIQKENGGVAQARQDGAFAAVGEYLCFVDADDWIEADYLETVNRYTDADIIQFGIFQENADESVSLVPPIEPEGFYNKEAIAQAIFPRLIHGENFTFHCTNLVAHVVRRELCLACMLKDARVILGEDLACVIPCVYSAESLCCISKCLYHYCYNRASATRGMLAYPWEDPKTIAAHLRGQMDLSSYDFEMQLKRRIAHLLFSIAVSQIRRKESYGTIRREILENISSGYYREVIEQVVFRGSIQGYVVKTTLKYRLIWPIWMYAKWKQRQ